MRATLDWTFSFEKRRRLKNSNGKSLKRGLTFLKFYGFTIFYLGLDFPRDGERALSPTIPRIFADIAATALAMHFYASSFSFAAAFQGPRIPTFMDPRCERKLEKCSGEMPPPRDLRSVCRREKAKVKTAETVSDQVLPRSQTETLHYEERNSSAATSWLYTMPRWWSLYVPNLRWTR